MVMFHSYVSLPEGKFGLSNPVTDIIGDVIDLKVLVKKYHLAKTFRAKIFLAVSGSSRNSI
jgi:hypothetical protein